MGRDNPPGRWLDGSVQVQAAPMDRPLRPQENGNIVGVAGLLGEGKEAVEGRREVQVPHHT